MGGNTPVKNWEKIRVIFKVSLVPRSFSCWIKAFLSALLLVFLLYSVYYTVFPCIKMFGYSEKHAFMSYNTLLAGSFRWLVLCCAQCPCMWQHSYCVL